ncbi:MAG: poly-beta-1,6-N-acetyl-D-glucosamine N-deacetylase PgaB [Thermodesulfobacteriota bacterium]
MPFFKREVLERWLLVALTLLCSAVVILAPLQVDAVDNHPFSTDADQFNYAKLLYEQGHYRVAAREFGKVIEDYPMSPLKRVAHFRMASAYDKAGMEREALLQLSQYTRNYPDRTRRPAASKTRRVAPEKKRVVPLPFIEPAVIVSPGVETPPLPVERLTRRAPPPLRAAQVAVFNGQSWSDVEREFDALKRAGVNTVILRVFQNRGDRFYSFVEHRGYEGVYFETTHAPVVADMLARVIAIAHARGMQLFAWMTTRYAGYGLGDRTDLECKAYDVTRDALVRCRGMDLFNDEALHHLEGLYADLAEYELDGILFQDDLVLRHTEGFGQHAEAYYLEKTGLALVPSAMYRVKGDGGVAYTTEFWRWAHWKNRRILEIAGRLMAAVKARRPETAFAINLMYETLSNPRYALAWLSQDLSAATREGFDYYAVMAYHRQMGSELGQSTIKIKALIEDMTAEAVEIVGDPGKVLIKLQSIDWETLRPIANAEINDVMNGVGKVKGVSLALFPYRTDVPLNDF